MRRGDFLRPMIRNVPNVPAAIFATRFVLADSRDWKADMCRDRDWRYVCGSRRNVVARNTDHGSLV